MYELRHQTTGSLISSHSSLEAALDEVRWMAWAGGRSLCESLALRQTAADGDTRVLDCGATLVTRAVIGPAVARAA